MKPIIDREVSASAAPNFRAGQNACMPRAGSIRSRSMIWYSLCTVECVRNSLELRNCRRTRVTSHVRQTSSRRERAGPVPPGAERKRGMSWTVGHSGRPTTSADWYDDRDTETSATERDWYARDGSASDTPDSFSTYGAHSAESDTHTEREISPDAWADSHLMGGAAPTEGEQRHSEGWHGTEGLLWDMDSVDSDSSSLFRAGSVDGSDAGPWSETERDRETESETSYAAELAVDWTVASSLHEPRARESERVSEHAHTQSAVAVPGWTVQSSVPKPNRGLLTHPQQHPQTPGSPAPRVAPVITGPRPGQQKVAKKQKKKKQTKTKSPGVCPLCSRATYCDVQDAVTQNLDMHAPLDGKGRCKAREQPRKDNRLGSWYRKSLPRRLILLATDPFWFGFLDCLERCSRFVSHGAGMGTLVSPTAKVALRASSHTSSCRRRGRAAGAFARRRASTASRCWMVSRRCRTAMCSPSSTPRSRAERAPLPRTVGESTTAARARRGNCAKCWLAPPWL